MSNGTVAVDTHLIASRIGPIFDPKFLNIIPEEKLKDIVIIQLKAQQSAIQSEIEAIDQIVSVVQNAKLGR